MTDSPAVIAVFIAAGHLIRVDLAFLTDALLIMFVQCERRIEASAFNQANALE